jgi:hypothetical protein
MSFTHQRLQGTVRHILFSAHSSTQRHGLKPAIDGLIVGIETQDIYLEKKRSWTRKVVLVTDGESPMEVEEWEAIVKKMSSLNISLTVV